MITAYTPTFGNTTLGLETGGVNLEITCALRTIATAYPAMQWLVSSPSVTRLLIVELWFSFMYASYMEGHCRILHRLQSGDGGLRRIHPRHLHGSDSLHGE